MPKPAPAPDHRDGPVSAGLRQVLAEVEPITEGAVLAGIPELAAVDPEQLGIALVSIDGHAYGAGDADVPFTIQSISKAFTFALALEDHGTERVLQHVGVEPSGEAFDAISIHPETGRPANPMINAGALVVTSLIDADHPADASRGSAVASRALPGASSRSTRPSTAPNSTPPAATADWPT